MNHSRGMAFGVFDGLHKGHEFFLSAAKEKCDELVVVVTLPEVVALFKGKVPLHDFDTRVSAIKKLNKKYVVVAGDREVGSWNVLKKYEPDMVFLGYDQKAIAVELDRLAVPYVFVDSHKPDTYKSSLLNASSSPEKRKIIIVDENNVPIGLKHREEVDRSKDIYRCTGIWITNSKGEVLIAQRSYSKRHDPGTWGPAVAGTIEEGETYESNAYKELEEEIGVTGVRLNPGPVTKPVAGWMFFGQWFYCTIDRPADEFVIQKDEVEGVKWITEAELRADIARNPKHYLPSLPNTIDMLMKLR